MLELGAEELDGVGDLERAARAGALVEHRGRQAREAELARRIVAAAGVDDEIDLHERHLVRLDEPDGEAVRRARASAIGGSVERAGAASDGGCERSGVPARRAAPAAMSRQRRETAASHGCLLRLDDELDAPLERQPLGGGGLHVGRRQRRVAREILGEVVGAAAGGEVRVELVGLAAESADALHAAVERRLDLVQRALDFARGGRLALQPRELLVDDARLSSAAV